MISETYIERFVKDRDEALFSLDEAKIKAYLRKYGETEVADAPELIFWAAVYKAILGITYAPDNLKRKARGWLARNGFCAIW